MPTPIHIQFTRFSAFYSPLISAVTGGFLQAEGLDPTVSVTGGGKTSIAGLVDGSVQVGQTAPLLGILAADRGEIPPAKHFAQVNELDGFFIAAKDASKPFKWKDLEGAKVIIDYAAQPLAMFKWGCFRHGVDFDKVIGVKVGTDDMVAAFRAGEADYAQLQGPAPQMLEHEGTGKVVASFGVGMTSCAFSSLAATPAFLETDTARAFGRAYRKARDYINDADPVEIAKAEQRFFPDVEPDVLAKTLAFYQKLGCWTRHVEITREAYDAVLDIFLKFDVIKTRPAYELVIAPTPN